MKTLILLIIILLLAYTWWPDPEPRPIEETFIGDQIAPLQKAQQFQQQDHLENLDQHREQMDAQIDADG
jgi:hypothetical protein